MWTLKSSWGVTLLELIVVLGIVAIFATLAVPSLQDFVIRNNTAAIANEFTASVLRTRSTAVNRNTCAVMCRSDDTALPTPQCAGTPGDWSKGWIIFVNAHCDSNMRNPELGDIADVVNATHPDFSLNAEAPPDVNPPSDYILFSPTGTTRGAHFTTFHLQYREETRSSNRTICLNTLGQTLTIPLQGVCP